jgi:hypothetical protein
MTGISPFVLKGDICSSIKEQSGLQKKRQLFRRKIATLCLQQAKLRKAKLSWLQMKGNDNFC